MGDYSQFESYGETKVLSVHRLRRTARAEERRLTNCILYGYPTELPYWAKGVRVEKAGLFQWAVVATSKRGH